ncbi:MAG: formyltransferase family protein [archaeon]
MMRTIVAGNNKLAADILEWLIENYREDVVGIVAEGKDMTDSDVLWERPFLPVASKISKIFDIPLFAGDINKHAPELEKLNPDLISPNRWKGLVKPIILDMPVYGCSNLHYGGLPKYGGMCPSFWAIMNGEEKVGVTLHWMEPGFDEGEIIDQRFFDITSGERVLELPDKEIVVRGWTDFEIYNHSNKLAAEMYQKNYPQMRLGREGGRKQDLGQRLYFDSKETDKKKGEVIESLQRLESLSEEEIGIRVRAMTFPYFGALKGKYKGMEVELKLEGK